MELESIGTHVCCSHTVSVGAQVAGKRGGDEGENCHLLFGASGLGRLLAAWSPRSARDAPAVAMG